jgi:hypothetical protein
MNVDFALECSLDELDAEMFRLLKDIGFKGYHRIKPWSRNLMLAMQVIEDCTILAGWSISLARDPVGWSVTIRPPMCTWVCEAEGETLPEAFCRAFVQEQDEAG